MNKNQILKALETLKKAYKLKESEYQEYIREITDYVKLSDEPSPKDPRYIEVRWLQKRIIEDVGEQKCDGLVFTKINSYIHEYEVKNNGAAQENT